MRIEFKVKKSRWIYYLVPLVLFLTALTGSAGLFLVLGLGTAIAIIIAGIFIFPSIHYFIDTDKKSLIIEGPENAEYDINNFVEINKGTTFEVIAPTSKLGELKKAFLMALSPILFARYSSPERERHALSGDCLLIRFKEPVKKYWEGSEVTLVARKSNISEITISPKDKSEFIKAVKEINPSCVIDNRIGELLNQLTKRQKISSFLIGIAAGSFSILPLIPFGIVEYYFIYRKAKNARVWIYFFVGFIISLVIFSYILVEIIHIQFLKLK
jgi:hypothetical protein